MTTQQATNYNDMNRNPTGKGGFGDHPENRNPGGWNKEMVFSYQYRRFMNMTLEEWNAFRVLPLDKKTVVEELAFNAVQRAKESLADVKEITDRTEGKAPQSIDMTSNGETISTPTVRIIDERQRDTDSSGTSPTT